MSIHIKPCGRCRKLRKERPTDRHGRKTCPNCRWIAITPPKYGRKSLGVFTTKESAEAALQTALVDYRRGIEPNAASITVDDLVRRFLDSAQNRVTPMTHHRYQQLWEMHALPGIGKMSIRDVRAMHIESLYTTLVRKPSRRKTPLSPRTVHHVHRFLFTVFAWGERKNIVLNNPMRKVDAPMAEESPVRELKPEEADAFLETAREHILFPFFLLAASTGARRGELAALTWDAVDLENKTMTIRQAIGSRFAKDADGKTRRHFYVKQTKSGRPRTIPLNANAIAALRMASARRAADKLASCGAYEDKGFVFADRTGGLINPDQISHAFAEIAKKAKLRDVSLHSLRHSAASWAIGSGLDLITVAALLGHTTPAITLRTYGHLQAGNQERAVGAIGKVLDSAKARRAVGEK